MTKGVPIKARLPVLLAALSCVLTLVCLVEIASLKSQLAQVENTVVSNVSHVTSQVGSISAQVDEALARQASILVSSDWSFGRADMETYTAPLTFTAVPKEQTPRVTTAALVCGGRTYPMTAGEDGKSLTLVAEVNGEETVRVPIPLNFDAYYLTEVPVQAEISLPAGAVLPLYAEVEDANGLRYRSFLNEIDTTENDAENAPCAPALAIYDSQGSLLWSEEY